MSGRRRTGEHGMALIGAVFLVVVLAALAFYMLTLSSTQHYTGMWAAQGARAHYAAQSGLQWGAYQAVNGGCPTNTTLSIDAGGATPFSVAVGCSSVGSYSELGATHTVWQISAVASLGAINSAGYVQRQQSATVVTTP